MAKIKNGLILYQVLTNGTLKGVYANNEPISAGQTFKDVATPRIAKSRKIDGYYDCVYDEYGRKDIKLNLKIDLKGLVYDFTWFDKDESDVWFRGVGYALRKNQIVVHYE